MVCATTFIIEILNGGAYSVFTLEYVVISPYKLVEVKSACGCGLWNGKLCPWVSPTNQLESFEGRIFRVRLHDLPY